MENDAALTVAIRELGKTWCGTPQEFTGPVSEEEIRAAEKELGLSFPSSYRAFLRRYGAGTVHYYDLYGLPRGQLWGDVVMMNQLDQRSLPSHYLKFMEDVGDYAYYLDTSRMNSAKECPVVVFGWEEDGEIVADNFVNFLQKAKDGLL